MVVVGRESRALGVVVAGDAVGEAGDASTVVDAAGIVVGVVSACVLTGV